jgi:hypothetical protein
VEIQYSSTPARWGLGKDGRTALVATGAGPVITEDLAVFLKPVATPPMRCRGWMRRP